MLAMFMISTYVQRGRVGRSCRQVGPTGNTLYVHHAVLSDSAHWRRDMNVSAYTSSPTSLPGSATASLFTFMSSPSKFTP